MVHSERVQRTPRAAPEAERTGAPGRAAEDSRQAAQRAIIESVQTSPAMVAQRMALRSAFGAAVQFAGVEDAADTRGGLPAPLRAGVEALSGVSMEGVRVHYDSPEPAQLNAHAYAQGRDIHLGPGQAHHLPHEAWHIAQQAQGRVAATTQLAGVSVNDDEGLEREADIMGSRASTSVAMTPAGGG